MTADQQSAYVDWQRGTTRHQDLAGNYIEWGPDEVPCDFTETCPAERHAVRCLELQANRVSPPQDRPASGEFKLPQSKWSLRFAV